MNLKIVFIFFTLSVTPIYDLWACGTCGCGVPNFQYGILPQNQNNFVGLRYAQRSFRSRLDASHTATHSKEIFQSLELWGKLCAAKRLQLFVFIPYNINYRQEGEIQTEVQGLGDVLISANYNLINTFKNTSDLKHSLLFGAGLKLPSGDFNALKSGLTINQNFQLGTGSFDILVSALYSVRHKNTGINTEFSYKYNTTNSNEYRFGNTTKTAVSIFQNFSSNSSITLMPNIGVGIETFGNSSQFKQEYSDSGGWAMFYHAGIESYYKKLAFGLTHTFLAVKNCLTVRSLRKAGYPRTLHSCSNFISNLQKSLYEKISYSDSSYILHNHFM